MRALTPIGRPVRYRAREGADGGQRQGEQDDERRDERVEREHHHHVDEQDGDAHRGEQAAEGLALLLADAGQLGGRAGRERACRLEAVEVGLDGLGHGPGIVAGDSAVMDEAGRSSIRVMLPWTSTWSTLAMAGAARWRPCPPAGP